MKKKNPVTYLDSYEPDYKHKCIVCGAKPVVTGVANGKVLVQTEMCGPCTWGENKTIDPKTWNEASE